VPMKCVRQHIVPNGLCEQKPPQRALLKVLVAICLNELKHDRVNLFHTLFLKAFDSESADLIVSLRLVRKRLTPFRLIYLISREQVR
jgi:hypothetical protein